MALDTIIEENKTAADSFKYIDLVMLIIFEFEVILIYFSDTVNAITSWFQNFDTSVVTVSLVFSLIELEIKGVAILRLLRLVRVIMAMKKF